MSALAACIEYIAGLPATAVEDDARSVLGTHGLGLVPVADPATFAWPGPFLGRRGDGGWVVCFGVPPGVVFDPAGGPTGGAAELVEALVIASHEVRRAARPAPAAAGVVEAIVIAPAAAAPARLVHRATALAGRGLEGDRYAEGAGTFSGSGGNGRHITLVEAEALEAAGVTPVQARRNVVVRGIALDALIGRRFRVGAVECAGQRRCEPCAHLERVSGPGVLRALVHRGGLRADLLSGGAIAVGDAVAAAA